MKKKIAAIIVALSMCIGVTGCSEVSKDGDCNFSHVDNEYIHLITVCDKEDGNVVAYDKDTKVLYYVFTDITQWELHQFIIQMVL